MARRGSVRYSANRADDRLASRTLLSPGATAGGHASGKVYVRRRRLVGASVASAGDLRAQVKVPLCGVLASFLAPKQHDNRHRVAIPVHPRERSSPCGALPNEYRMRRTAPGLYASANITQ